MDIITSLEGKLEKVNLLVEEVWKLPIETLTGLKSFNPFQEGYNASLLAKSDLWFNETVSLASLLLGESNQQVIDFSSHWHDKHEKLCFRDQMLWKVVRARHDLMSIIEVSKIQDDIEIRVKGFRDKLELRNVHPAIFAFCRAELVADNYFHAVLEANKGLLQRIRDISGVEADGNRLIEQVFSNKPVVIINSFRTQSEKDEHTGFCNLLRGLCGMFRNPLSHVPKEEWPISEQDALEILGIISYCHRRLDNARKI